MQVRQEHACEDGLEMDVKVETEVPIRPAPCSHKPCILNPCSTAQQDAKPIVCSGATMEDLLLQTINLLDDISDEDLSAILTLGRPWLGRLHRDRGEWPWNPACSVDSEDELSETDDDSNGLVPSRRREFQWRYRKPETKPILYTLFEIYRRYQEERLAEYLQLPSSERVHIKVDKYMDGGFVGTVWKQQLGRLITVLGP